MRLRRAMEAVRSVIADEPGRLHVACSVDIENAQLRLYVDGSMLAQERFTGSWGTPAAGDVILSLADGGGGAHWLGTFFGAAVYDRVLTPEEVLTNYYAELE